jgi:Arc/MetJ-type ribon-helix-helix transcriptional regulator
MSTQIAVRLPDEIVAYIDEQVRSGRARSRAAVLSRAVTRDVRRERAERDLAVILAGKAAGDIDADTFDNLSAAASQTELDID